jgi:hypothetical protein
VIVRPNIDLDHGALRDFRRRVERATRESRQPGLRLHVMAAPPAGPQQPALFGPAAAGVAALLLLGLTVVRVKGPAR